MKVILRSSVYILPLVPMGLCESPVHCLCAHLQCLGMTGDFPACAVSSSSCTRTMVQTRIESTPQEAMKRRMCPVSQDKVSLGAGVKACTGMVRSEFCSAQVQNPS